MRLLLYARGLRTVPENVKGAWHGAKARSAPRAGPASTFFGATVQGDWKALTTYVINVVMAGGAVKKAVYLRGIPSDVIREAKAAAARRGVTLAGFVADTLARAVREPDPEAKQADDLSDEMRWYERNRARIARRFHGEYVAIIDQRVIDHDLDFERLATRVFENNGTRNVFMPRVTAAGHVLHVRSPRVRRGP
jgi:hypothetical protein